MLMIVYNVKEISFFLLFGSDGTLYHNQLQYLYSYCIVDKMDRNRENIQWMKSIEKFKVLRK